MLASLSYLLLLAVLALGTVRYPAAAVAGVICMFGLEQWGQASGSTLAGHQAFTNIAIGSIVIVGIGMRLLRGPTLVARLPSTYWLVASLFTYAFLSILWTPDPSGAFDNWQRSYLYVITIVLATPLLCTAREDFVTALRWVVVIGGSICVAVLFFGHWGHRGLIIDALYEAEANPLALATVAGQAAITLMLFPVCKSRVLRWTAVVLLVPICLAVVVRTGSRGQLLAVLAAVAVAVPLSGARIRATRLISIPILLAALAAIAYASLGYFGGDADRWNYNLATNDVEGRLDMAAVLLAKSTASAETLLFGLGTSASYHLLGIYPHVVALEILGEEGLIGFGLFLAILAFCGRDLVRSFAHTDNDPAVRGALAALTGALVFHLLVSFKQGSMLLNPLLFMHAVLVPKLVLTMISTTTPKPAAAVPADRFPNLLRS
jgi:hypothetical protein